MTHSRRRGVPFVDNYCFAAITVLCNPLSTSTKNEAIQNCLWKNASPLHAIPCLPRSFRLIHALPLTSGLFQVSSPRKLKRTMKLPALYLLLSCCFSSAGHAAVKPNINDKEVSRFLAEEKVGASGVLFLMTMRAFWWHAMYPNQGSWEAVHSNGLP